MVYAQSDPNISNKGTESLVAEAKRLYPKVLISGQLIILMIWKTGIERKGKQ